MPALKLPIPSWLGSIILAIAAWLKGFSQGREAQAKDDAAATEAAAAKNEKAVQDAKAEVDGLAPDAVQKELGEWQTPD